MDLSLKNYDINSGQFFYIIYICDNEGITQDEITSLVHVHASNVSRALEALYTKGYITKETLESDRRTFKLYPTEQAKKIYHKLMEIQSEWVVTITDDFSAEEFELLDKLLRKADLNLIKYLNSIR